MNRITGDLLSKKPFRKTFSNPRTGEEFYYDHGLDVVVQLDFRSPRPVLLEVVGYKAKNRVVVEISGGNDIRLPERVTLRSYEELVVV